MASQEDSGAVEKSAIPSEVVDCIRVVVKDLLEQGAAARGGGSGGTSLSGPLPLQWQLQLLGWLEKHLLLDPLLEVGVIDM